MTVEMVWVVGILIAAIVLFISEKVRVDVVALGVVVLLMPHQTIDDRRGVGGFLQHGRLDYRCFVHRGRRGDEHRLSRSHWAANINDFRQ